MDYSENPFAPGEDERDDASSTQAEFAWWRHVFADLNPSSVLERLRESDPVFVRARCKRRLAEQAYVLDLETIVQGTLLGLAMRSIYYSEVPELSFMDTCMDRAISGALRIDSAAAEEGQAPDEPLEPRLEHLCSVLGIDSENALAAVSLIHQHNLANRRVFFDAFFLGHGIDEIARRTGQSGARVKERILRILKSLRHPPGGGDD